MPKSAVLVFAMLLSLTVGCDSDSDPVRGNPPGRLYVLNQGDGTLYIYDTQSLTRTDSVDLGTTNPHFIEFTPAGDEYYVVALENFGTISKYSVADNSATGSAATPSQTVPSAIAVTDAGFGYVCNFQGVTPAERTRVLKYDLATMTLVTDQILAGAITHDLRSTSDGEIVIASNRTSNDVTMIYTDADTVLWVPIDPDSLYPVPTIKYGPFGILIDPNDERAFIACVDAFQVRVLDIAQRRITDSIAIPVSPSTVPGTISGPTLMAYDPASDLLFVTTQFGNSVVAVRVATKEVVADIPLGTPRPFGVTVSEDGSRVYVACVNPLGARGRVYVIDNDVTPPRLQDSLDVGNQSFGLVWRPL